VSKRISVVVLVALLALVAVGIALGDFGDIAFNGRTL
jgi:hypothetical protein